MKSVVILGNTGMLGRALNQTFHEENIEVKVVNRGGKAFFPGDIPYKFELMKDSLSELLDNFERNTVIVNAIGAIKQKFGLLNEKEIWFLNSEFPRQLAMESLARDFSILQIGTDCVFRGSRGKYLESDVHDATDLYGKSKSSGESELNNVMTIRCSIIGRELNSAFSLMEWFLRQPKNSTVAGFQNHFWNGVTVYQFSKLVLSLVRQREFFPGVSHFTPSEVVNKFELLKMIRTSFGREDIHLVPTDSSEFIDRSLSTQFPKRNVQFWSMIGYPAIPSIDQIVKEYAIWSGRRLD